MVEIDIFLNKCNQVLMETVSKNLLIDIRNAVWGISLTPNYKSILDHSYHDNYVFCQEMQPIDYIFSDYGMIHIETHKKGIKNVDEICFGKIHLYNVISGKNNENLITYELEVNELFNKN